MSRAEYATKQRRAVYDFFLNHKDGCYTAKEITESGETGASAATIYRILAYLTEKGTLDKYTDENGVTFYRLNSCTSSEHFHLKCVECGKLIHMNCEQMVDVVRHIEREHGFIVNSGITTLYGLCRECRKETEENA